MRKVNSENTNYYKNVQRLKIFYLYQNISFTLNMKKFEIALIKGLIQM